MAASDVPNASADGLADLEIRPGRVLRAIARIKCASAWLMAGWPARQQSSWPRHSVSMQAADFGLPQGSDRL